MTEVDIDKNSTLGCRTRLKTPLELDSAGESRVVAKMNFFVVGKSKIRV